LFTSHFFDFVVFSFCEKVETEKEIRANMIKKLRMIISDVCRI